MVSLNWIAIAVLTLCNWIGGAIWFGPIFGKLWGRIHGMDCVDPKEKKKAMESVWKLMLAELIASALMIGYLASLIALLPVYTPLQIAFSSWFGLVLPTTVSSVLWGNDPKKYMFIKVVLSSSFRLLALLGSAWVFGMWK